MDTGQSVKRDSATPISPPVIQTEAVSVCFNSFILPMLSWQSYKENVLEPMLNGTEKVPAMITDFKEYHTDTTVRFVVKMSEEKLQEAEHAGLHKVFKLQTPLTCNSMVMPTTPCLHRNVSCSERTC